MTLLNLELENARPGTRLPRSLFDSNYGGFSATRLTLTLHYWGMAVFNPLVDTASCFHLQTAQHASIHSSASSLAIPIAIRHNNSGHINDWQVILIPTLPPRLIPEICMPHQAWFIHLFIFLLYINVFRFLLYIQSLCLFGLLCLPFQLR